MLRQQISDLQLRFWLFRGFFFWLIWHYFLTFLIKFLWFWVDKLFDIWQAVILANHEYLLAIFITSWVSIKYIPSIFTIILPQPSLHSLPHQICWNPRMKLTLINFLFFISFFLLFLANIVLIVLDHLLLEKCESFL